jgi:hypothetical protein
MQIAGHIVLADLGLVLGLGHGGDDQLAIDGNARFALCMPEGPTQGTLEDPGLEIDLGPRLDDLAGHVPALHRLRARYAADCDLATAPGFLLTVELLGEVLVDVRAVARIVLSASRLEAENNESGCGGRADCIESNGHP